MNGQSHKTLPHQLNNSEFYHPPMKKTLFLLSVLIIHTLHAQENQNFAKEVNAIKVKYDTLWDASKPTIVFTGSSSIRLWSDLEDRFQDHQILNTGFGGSQSYDLLVHLSALVLDYKPEKVFIYEGDNDINDKKSPRLVLETMEQITRRIQEQDKSTKIILISAKPSISRWRLRGKYKRLNRKLKKFTESDHNIMFVNVWDVMLEGRKLNETLFIEDGLHMNDKGYDIWYNALKGMLD